MSDSKDFELNLTVSNFELFDRCGNRLCICTRSDLLKNVRYFLSHCLDVEIVPILEKSVYFATDYPSIRPDFSTTSLPFPFEVSNENR